MEKEEFKEFLEEHILPIFTGSEIIGEEPSIPRETEVAQGTGGSILAKSCRKDNYRIIIKRVQPFKNFEVSLVKSVIKELKGISNSNLSKEYIDKIQAYSIEKAICKAVSQFASTTLVGLINKISIWGQRTYEGQRPTFGFVISSKKLSQSKKIIKKINNENLVEKNCDKNDSSLTTVANVQKIDDVEKMSANNHFSEFLSYDFSALLSDGKDTCLELSADGYLTGYINIPNCKKNDILGPYNFIKMANYCSGNRVGVSLLENGDILLFKDRMLVFAKRNGSWMSFSHEEVIQKLANRGKNLVEDVRKATYLTSLDTAFAKSGGCIVHLNEEDLESALKHIDINDILIPEYYEIRRNQTESFLEKKDDKNKSYDEFLNSEDGLKVANLRVIINGKKFYQLSRKIRQELVGVDGATIIDNDGSLVAVGAIIKIEAGSTGGGRLAATKTLAKYGVALKISTDGSIEGFGWDRNKSKVKALFVL